MLLVLPFVVNISYFSMRSGLKTPYVNTSQNSEENLHIAVLCDDFVYIHGYSGTINSFDANGYTPLHLAAKYLNVKSMLVLLEKGVDAKAIAASSGYTACKSFFDSNSTYGAQCIF